MRVTRLEIRSFRSIVEGQADYLIVHALGRAQDYDLDEHGVSVIDAQNNGSPDIGLQGRLAFPDGVPNGYRSTPKAAHWDRPLPSSPTFSAEPSTGRRPVLRGPRLRQDTRARVSPAC